MELTEEKLEKIWATGLTTGSYTYLWMCSVDSRLLKYRTIYNALKEDMMNLITSKYIDNENKLTGLGRGVLDNIENIKGKIPVASLHKELQDILVEHTGKKQKVIDRKYSFLCNATDLSAKLNKVVKKYKIEDINKLHKVLKEYVRTCCKNDFYRVKLVEYYIMKDNVSQLYTDYENYESATEQEVKTVPELTKVNNLF